MSYRFISLAAAFVLASAAPAAALDGEILITQAKALAGNVTPGDAKDYPITLSKPGTYKLASDLTVNRANANGIVVTSHDVTIDFNGFRLAGSNLGQVGILGSMNSLTIRNGMIALFKNDAIRGSGPFWMIDSMRIVLNGGDGIEGTGAARQWIISNSEIVENGRTGIYNDSSAAGTLVRNNLVNGNDAYGLYVSQAHIEGNMISGNGSPGGTRDSGIVIFEGMVLGNTIINNDGWGIDTGNVEVGIGNNTLSGNFDDSGSQISGGSSIHPNVCNGATC